MLFLSGMREFLRRLQSKGATLLEYGVLLGLLSMATIVAIAVTGIKVERIYCISAGAVAYYVLDIDGICRDVAVIDPIDEGAGEGVPVVEEEEEEGVFEPNLLVHDVVLPVGSQDLEVIVFELEGTITKPFFYQVHRTFNTEMTGATVSVSANSTGTVTPWSSLGADDRTLPVKLVRKNVAGLGVRVTPSYDVFVEVEGRYDLILWSLDDRSDARTYSFKVTREAEVLVFDPVLEVEDRVLTHETQGYQLEWFALSGPMNSQVGMSVRRLNGEFFDSHTRGARVNDFGTHTVISEAQGEQQGTDGKFIPEGTAGLGVLVFPDGGIFDESVGEYEIAIWPMPNPNDRRVFTFSITRPPQDLVFEPELSVVDVTLPIRATGRQNVLFELNGTMNSKVVYTVERLTDRNIADYTWASQRLKTGIVGIVGGTTGNDVRSKEGVIDPSDVSHLGITLEPTSEPFVDALGSYRLHLWPENREDLARSYTFMVERGADTIVFEPELAVADVVLPARTTTRQLLTFDLTGTMNSDVSFTVTRLNSANVEHYTWATQRTRQGMTSGVQSTTGEGAPSPAVEFVPRDIRALGIALEPVEDIYAESAGEYEITIWPETATEMARRYRFSVTRPAVELVFNPSLAVSNTTFAEGHTASQQLLFDLSGAFNTHIGYQVRRVQSTNMENTTSVLRQQGTSTPSIVSSVSGDGASSQVTFDPTGTSRLGIAVQPGSDVFAASSATYELVVWSVARPADTRTYTVSVNRPARVLRFDPRVAVRNTTFPLGTNTAQDVLFDLSGAMDTDLVYRVRRIEHENLGGSNIAVLSRNASGSVVAHTTISNSSTSGASSELTFKPADVTGFGVRLTPAYDRFVETRAVFEMEVSSAVDRTKTRTFTFTVVRPADTVVFNPVLEVSTVTFPAGTYGRQDVMFDLTGGSNVQMRYSLRRVNAAGFNDNTTARHKLADGRTTSGSYSNNGNVVVEDNLAFGTDVVGLGVQFNFDATRLNFPASATYEYVIWSDYNPTDRRTFRFTVNRPGQ